MSNRAWVTLATNDSYGLGALVLANSLRRAGSVNQAVVLITPSVTDAMRDRLRAVFAEVIMVDVLDSRDAAHLALLQRPELGITFTKLHCWSLTQYEKCVFLDADTLIVQNCDELFDREELSAAPDVGWPDCFNSGVFVYCPSADTYSRLITFAKERGSFDGGDQGLLNAFFSDWARGDINKHLPFLYNVTSAAFYSYIPAMKHYGQDLKIIHFIGSAKPWLQQFNWDSRSVDAPEHLRQFLQLWWDIFVSDVHSQLDTAMETTIDVVGAQPDMPEEYPEDVQNYYEPKLDSRSEFPWHHPETQPEKSSEQTQQIDLSHFYDPWKHYRGNIPSSDYYPSSFEAQDEYNKTVKEFQSLQQEYNKSWLEQNVQHTLEQSHQTNDLRQREQYHDHTDHQHQNNQPSEHSGNNHSHNQGHYQHPSYQQEHSLHSYSYHQDSTDADLAYFNRQEHEHDSSEHFPTHYVQEQQYNNSNHSHNQDNQHSNFNLPHYQETHSSISQSHIHNQGLHDITTNSPSSNINDDHSHNFSSHNVGNHNNEQKPITHYTFNQPKVKYVYHLHLDIRNRSKRARRQKVHHNIQTHTAHCTLLNGHISDTESEDEELTIPRHPYDGFYLRHIPTIDSRGRKICLHEIPPTPSPSPPESLQSVESSSIHSEDYHSASECEDQTGVAGNLARVVPGSTGYQREAIDELTRRQGWEAGNIDYMGADSFDNIWAKISQTLSQSRSSPPKQPSPPRKEPSPPRKEPSPPRKEPSLPKELKQETVASLPAASTLTTPPAQVTAEPTPLPVETLPAAPTPLSAETIDSAVSASAEPKTVPAESTDAPVKSVSSPPPPSETVQPEATAPSQAEESKTVEGALTTVPDSAVAPVAPTEDAPKIESTGPSTPPTTPKTTPEASTPVTESSPKLVLSETESALAADVTPALSDEGPATSSAPAPAQTTATPEKPMESSAGTTISTDSPPLANTPSKEDVPVVPTAKSEERRKPAGKLQLSPPAAADPLPTPDSELEDAAALAHAIIASELSTTVTAASPSADPISPLPTKDSKQLSVEEPDIPTPPVSLAQIGVKPKAKPTTAAQIESSVAEKSEPETPTTPTTPSEPGTPTEAPKKKVTKKITKKESGSSGDASTPVPPPRKKEKKPKDK